MMMHMQHLHCKCWPINLRITNSIETQWCFYCFSQRTHTFEYWLDKDVHYSEKMADWSVVSINRSQQSIVLNVDKIHVLKGSERTTVQGWIINLYLIYFYLIYLNQILAWHRGACVQNHDWNWWERVVGFKVKSRHRENYKLFWEVRVIFFSKSLKHAAHFPQIIVARDWVFWGHQVYRKAQTVSQR